METSSYAVIGSIITSCLVIIVPIVKSAFDNYAEKKNRVFDNELKVKREIYEEFLISAAKLSTLKGSERHEFISAAMKICLYCDDDVRFSIIKLVQTVEDLGKNSPDTTLEDALSFSSKSKIDHAIIYDIASELKKELNTITLEYSDSYSNKLKQRHIKKQIRKNKAKKGKK